MRKLFIIGASNLGREFESWLDLIPPEKRDWKLEGYLHTDSELSPLEGFPTDYKIIGNWENYKFSQNDYGIIAVANVDWRKSIYQFLKGRLTFFTYIAPNSTIAKFVEIGEGSFICPFCILATNVRIGANVFVNCGTQIGHDTRVDEHSSIMADVVIGGNCKIGTKVFIGSNSTIIPKMILENESSIGAGSVVIRRVKSKTSVFGNPAMILK